MPTVSAVPAKPKGDPILRIMELFQADTRPDKIDLSVGVYKTTEGHTPVLASVKEAERRILGAEQSKTYLGLAGNVGFSKALGELIFGTDGWASGSIASLQSVGGSGALRLIFEYARQRAGIKRVHVSVPTWENQSGIAAATGLEIGRYPYFDRQSSSLQFEVMLDALGKLGPEDAVLLHGCCHNPTGTDLNRAQWQAVADLALARGWLPMVDLAYAGFGTSLEQDTAGLNLLRATVPTTLVAASCSKNFGLYRERVGAAYIATESPDHAVSAAAEMMRIAREIYSMPPDHGAAIVQTILTDAGLRAMWFEELGQMRDRINEMRALLSQALNRLDGSNRFDHLASQRGMFSLLELSVEQVCRLRDEFAVYLIEDGRTNVAGITAANVDATARALLAVWK